MALLSPAEIKTKSSVSQIRPRLELWGGTSRPKEVQRRM